MTQNTNQYVAILDGGNELTFIAKNRNNAINIAREIIQNNVLSLRRKFKSGKLGVELLDSFTDKIMRL